MELTAGKKRIIVLNKTDLGQKLTAAEIAKESGSEVISTSIMMKETWTNWKPDQEAFLQGDRKLQRPGPGPTSGRRAFGQGQQLADVASGLEAGMPVDLVR